jgi:hypothetical protein
MLTCCLDRDEALRDDFHLESASYDYGDDEEWGDEEANWTADDNPEDEETSDARDESTAYLEFLNEEVSLPQTIPGRLDGGADRRWCRRRSSVPASKTTNPTTILARIVSCSSLLSTRSSPISCSARR